MVSTCFEKYARQIGSFPQVELKKEIETTTQLICIWVILCASLQWGKMWKEVLSIVNTSNSSTGYDMIILSSTNWKLSTIDWFQKLLFPKTRHFSPEEYGGKHEPPTRRDLHCDKSAPGRIRNLQRFGRSPSRRSPSDRLGIYTTKGQEAFPREEIETTWSFHVCFKVNFQGEKPWNMGRLTEIAGLKS